MKEYKHFSKKELCCPHCDMCGIDDGFMQILEKIREEIDIPLFVTSAYRCPEYNSIISTTGPAGPHTTGKAVDIMISGASAYNLIRLGLEFNIVGIGVNQKGSFAKRFVHLDMIESNLRPRFWSY